MKSLLIINPYSRSGKSAILAEKCINYLKKTDFSFETAYLKNFDDAYSFSKEANKMNYENIIALGGDGTINKVVNGFYDDNGSRVSDSAFGVIYTGTSPDFCRSYNIPLYLFEACELIRNRKTIEIPVGMIKFRKNDSSINIETESEALHYFVCCANIGLGAMLAHQANSGIRKYLGDFLGTLTSLIKILTTYKGKNYQIRTDNTYKDLKKVFNISVGITNYIASGIKVSTDMQRDYRLLYVMTVSNIKLNNIYNLLKQVYSGKIQSDSDIISLSYSEKISINGISDLPDVEFDGDPAGFLPCSLEIAKDKLKLLSDRVIK